MLRERAYVRATNPRKPGMSSQPLLIALSLVTLVIVLGAGILQLRRVRASQARRGEAPGGMAGPSNNPPQ